MKELVKEELVRIRKALMTGVGYMIPFVVFGGIFIALSIAISGIEPGEGVVINNSFLKTLNDLGTKSMGLMVPVLAAFIAFGLADRGGIMPGLLGGLIATDSGAGFIGGIIAGILGGYIVMWVKKIPVPTTLRALTPIFIIPLIAGLATALFMHYIVAEPVGILMEALTNFLQSLQGGSVILLAIILGAMVAFDMGGPVNVVACLFAWSFFPEGIYTLAAPVAVAICTPPLGMGLATLLSKKKYNSIDRESGKAALLMGMIGISEGAIPFAAKDPFRVILSNCVGGAVGAVIAMLANVATYAPHGGPIVIFVTENKLWYLIAIIVGSLVTALIYNAIKKSPKDSEDAEESDDLDFLGV